MNHWTKRVLRNVCAVAALKTALMVGTEARAQGGNPNIFLDELGQGTIQFPGGPVVPLPGVPQPDPGPGGLPNALTYNLQGPPNLIIGDLIIQEVAGGPPSDLIRFNFNPATGLATAVFYSDPPEPGEPFVPADIGFPAALYANQAFLPEVAIPGGFGAIYTPNANQPGFVPGFAVTYTILSDVPTPGSAVVLGLGGLLAGRRRR